MGPKSVISEVKPVSFQSTAFKAASSGSGTSFNADLSCGSTNVINEWSRNYFNEFLDTKLETEFVNYHNKRNARMVKNVMTTVYTVVTFQALMTLLVNFEEALWPEITIMMGITIAAAMVGLGQRTKNPFVTQWLTSSCIFWYFLFAIIIGNIIEGALDTNTFMRQTVMVTILISPCLFFRALCRYSFTFSWLVVIIDSIAAVWAGDGANAFFGMLGIGYIAILYFLNACFCYAAKALDKMYRIEFLLYRRLGLENEKLQRRLNAIELMRQGRLDVDDDIKDYLNANFTMTSGMQQISKKSARNAQGVITLPSAMTTSSDNKTSNVQSEVVPLMARVTELEPFVHKYAPNTLITMVHSDISTYSHRIYMAGNDNNSTYREYAIPVVDRPVNMNEMSKGTLVTPSNSTYEYDVQRDHPGIQHFTGDFAEFIKTYDINLFEFPTLYSCKFTDGQSLVLIVCTALDRLGLFDSASLLIDKQALTLFLATVQSGYSTDAPYHNAMHACDVVVSMLYFIKNCTKLDDNLSDVEKFACIIAAACHDFQHLACNNNFLVKIGHDLALFYNDYSVLENHHASASLRIAKLKGCDLFSTLSDEDSVAMRDIIINMILSTDMKHHFRIVKEFTTLLDGGGVDMNKYDDKMLVLRMLIKLCDVGHVLKPKADTVEWTRRINEEFFIQGDAEAARGLPVSPMMSRTTQIPKGQVGFLQFVCKPLVSAWCEFVENDYLSTRLTSIMSYWERLRDQNVTDARYVDE